MSSRQASRRGRAYRVKLVPPVEVFAKQQLHERLPRAQHVCMLQVLECFSQVSLRNLVAPLRASVAVLQHVQVEHSKRDERRQAVRLLAHGVLAHRADGAGCVNERLTSARTS